MSGREHSAELLSDRSRVIARLFLPGEGVSSTHSRAAEIVARVLTIPADVIESMAATLLADFSTRHTGVSFLFDDNAQAVSSRIASAIPVTASQRIVHGMEDARFVRFTDADGSIGYRATYTAYDGYDIPPRLITSPDLASFAIHRLSGSAAHNKGMESRGPPIAAVALCILWQCNAHRPEIVEVSVDNLKEVRRWDPALVATQMGTQNAGDQRSVVSADQPPSQALVA